MTARNEETFCLHRNEETFRLQLRLPQASIDRLERLEKRTEALSLAEVARKALRLYEVVLDAQSSGEMLFIQKDGELVPVVMML